MRVNNRDMYNEYKDKVMAWIEEQAKNPEVTEIDVNITADDMGVGISDTNGWQHDWWSDDIVEFGRRRWEVSGGSWYGTVSLSIPEDDEDYCECDNCMDKKECDWLVDGERCYE